MRDLRLRPALELVDSGVVSLLSLDVFDTLLWRAVPEPTDAFVLLGHRLREFDLLSDGISAELFGRTRRVAEQEARRRLTRRGDFPEVNLDEIYAVLPPWLFRGIDPSKAVHVEVDLEEELLFVDRNVLELARRAQERDVRVALVSDTYFTEEQIRRFLASAAPRFEPDVLLTSNLFRHGKATGLFSTLLDRMDVRPASVLHVGDNPDADSAPARAVGIRVVEYPKVGRELRTVLEREDVLPAGDDEEITKDLDPGSGDRGLTALRSRVVHDQARLEVATGLQPYWEFGATVLGPVFAGFAEWIHRRANEEGYETVHCLMREGEYLTVLLDRAAPVVGSSVASAKLWASRSLVARAAIFQGSTEEILPFLYRRLPPRVSDVCAALGVPIARIPALQSLAETTTDDPVAAQALMHHLTEGDVRAQIVARSARLRRRLVAHILEVLGTRSGTVAIADLGWGATIQTLLQRILKDSGVDIEMHGFYLATSDLATERSLAGLRAEGYIGQGGYPRGSVPWIVRSPEVLEQVLMPPIGSLEDIEDDGTLRFGVVREDQIQVAQKDAVRRGIFAFQDLWNDHAAASARPTLDLSRSGQPLLLNVVRRFILRPTVHEASLFTGWQHDDNFGTTGSGAVVDERVIDLLHHMNPADLVNLPPRELYWPFGVATVYDEPLATLAAAIAERRVDEQAFRGGRLANQTDFFVDLGDGFRDEHHVGVDIRANPNGLCLASARLGGYRIRALRIDPVRAPSLVRIDRIRLRLGVENRQEPVELTFGSGDELGDWQLYKCQWLHGNVLLSLGDDPQMILFLDDLVDGRVFQVTVEIAFAVLRLTAPGAVTDTWPDLLRASGRSKLGRTSRRVSSELRRRGPGGVARMIWSYLRWVGRGRPRYR